MKTMKKMKIPAKNEQKIENCAEKLQKMDENPKFSVGVGEMLLWGMLPNLLNAYYAFYDYLSLMYSRSNVIIGVKDNVKGKKEIRK